MSELEVLESITKIQTELKLPESRREALAHAMKTNPQRCSEIVDLFNDVNGSRFIGGEDRFLSFLTNLIVD